jgi:hypothetical protein
MKVTVEVSSQNELEKIVQFFQTLNLDSIRIMTDSLMPKPKKNKKKGMKIAKGDKSIDPSDLFGMWKDNPRSIETIRKKAWQRPEIL